MGFWSFVGSCCSAVGSFVSSAVSAVGRVVTKVAGFAGKVLSTVATVGEKVIKAVKTVWPVVKPWIAKFSNVLNAIPVVGPYLSIAAKTLLALENSPILKKVAQIAENVLPKMKVIGQSLSSWAEIRKAREDAEVLRQAEAEMRNNTERNALCLAQIINKFLIVNSSVVKMIDEDEVTDLESYLRLRADVRILDHVKKHLHEAKGLEDISSDDLFILNFSDKILNNEEVSDVEAGRFEQIINKIYGKSLISLVFNDMVVQWARDLENDRTKEKDLFVEITDAGVKDIILPGEIREIMNTVLVAEKRAQANVITRREEVASTRSLLNTAKLMDENQTLYKLKELEYVERICENVGNISLNGNGNILSQLTAILNGNNV